MEELIALMALSRMPAPARDKKRSLVEEFGGAARLFANPERIPEEALRKAIRSFKGGEEIGRELQELGKMNVKVIPLGSAEYPDLLSRIPDPPLVLYVRGAFPASPHRIAVVGSRKATFEGMSIAERTAESLSSLGVTVVSGLARGIDAMAHKGALKGSGKTIAVLGCGIDICYPAENRHLFGRIAADGAIITEYGLGEKPLKHHFPERNRIIAGLSEGVLVIEATARSGSLITARHALEYGREVMAIPGRIFDDEYRGANALIREGARLVAGIEDIVNACFPGFEPVVEKPLALDEKENYIYTVMGRGRVHVDELVEKSHLEAKQVMVILTRLEMKDVVQPIPGGFYIRKV